MGKLKPWHRMRSCTGLRRIERQGGSVHKKRYYRIPALINPIGPRILLKHALGAIQVLRNAIFLEIGPPLPRNANNIEHYTFVTLFSRKSDTPPPPSALRNTWMAPCCSQVFWQILSDFTCSY